MVRRTDARGSVSQYRKKKEDREKEELRESEKDVYFVLRDRGEIQSRTA